jgi:hypothetical protein
MIGCGPGGGRFGKWWTSLSQTEVEFKDMYAQKGSPSISHGEAAERLVAVSLLHYPQRLTC